MEDSELEEGEACDYALDPDAYSYIDEKIENYLGHLQREFVAGELSAEHLGAKFGGYGSFLPTHRRSPTVLSQPRSPAKPPNHRNSVSPYNPPLEGTHHNRSVVTGTSISSRNIPKRVPSTDNLAMKETLTSGPSSRQLPTQKHNPSKNSVGGGSNDQKTLKVRIKVGNENALRRNNAAIYSGLGLDISPSSSYEASSGGSAGPSAESRGIPSESPQSILETMTCSLIPGGDLLSPIKGCFMNFTGKTTPPMLKNAPKTSQSLAKSNFLAKEAKGHKLKNSRPDEKNHTHSGSKALKELPALPSKEQTSRIDLVKEKVELVEGDQSYASKSVENGDVNSKDKPKLKSIRGEKKAVDSNKERFRDSSSLDTQRKNKSETKKKISISKADSVESNKNGDQYAGPSNAMNNLVEVENAAEVKVQPQYDERRVQKEKQSSNSTSTDRKKESVMRSKKLDTLQKHELEKEFTCEFSEEDLSEKRKKSGSVKIQNEKDFTSLREAAPKERPSNNRFEKEPVLEAQVNNFVPAPSNINLTTAEASVPPNPPVEIKENWVGCDKCHKWRLLPYWTNPESLPKKWHCKLLDWLPGMNRCDVGEEETTAGANALNLVQLPLPVTLNASAVLLPDANVTAPLPGGVQSVSLLPSQISKKKKEHREGTDLTNPMKKREKASLKGNLETSSYGSGGLGIESRSADFTAEKQKFKHQNSGRRSDGGDTMGKASNHSKSKNKRPIEPDDSKASKKIKKENSHSNAKEKRPEADLPGNAALDTANISSKKMSLKSSLNERLDTKGAKVERRENFSMPENERPDRVSERIDVAQEKKMREQKHGEKAPNSNRRDMAYAHPSAEATSSSSKVSGSRSRRSKTKLLERRGSPVESVSSSPVRHLSSEKLHRKGIPLKEEVVNIASYTLPMVSPKRGPSTEIDRPSKQPRLSETQRSMAEDLKAVGSSRNVPPEQDSEYLEKKSVQLIDRPNHHENHDGLDQRKTLKSEPKVSSRPKEKHRSHLDKAATAKPQTSGSKLEPEVSRTQIGSSTVNENRIQQNGDFPKAPPPKKPEIANGLPSNAIRQAAPNLLDKSSPARRDGHSAVFALLKEARALKHTADRMKNDQSELDSTRLYFEAALKFLQAASLCEPASGDTSRQGETTQAMQIYSDTAKLCEFCAHVYERCKKMGAAALAYKCVEVAYFKAAFYKTPGASRDRHELQATLQMVQLGESPSSSASDIDNLNNHGLAKVASVKDSNSPQVAGANHLLAGRNQPPMMRILTYANDLTSAFEATRKYQIAFAAVTNPNPVHGEVDANGIASIGSALNFGYHNVRELLQLVRVSMECLSLV
ncbi:hypothetical protein LUZ63_007933 [Rhynchospora breviuscula]|uniref:CW-type domain-containing protein n=1 Tax=Rhynchospora breviuscula TaxID=2022672 RepID=A0A9Q0CSU4_9POAL|nr:hypothetical protein LUZ63_007933 [Rhynchospora breviuscula]